MPLLSPRFKQNIFIIIKLLSIWYILYFISFTHILEDKTKIYWCFGSFPSDDNIKYLIISTCLGIIPSSLYIVFATFAVVPANKKGL